MYNQILIHSSENLFLFLCSFSDMAMYTAMCIFWFSTYLACLYRKVRLKSQKCYFKSPCQTCVNYMGIKFLHACSEILNVSKFGKLSLVLRLVIRQVILNNKGLFYNGLIVKMQEYWLKIGFKRHYYKSCACCKMIR